MATANIGFATRKGKGNRRSRFDGVAVTKRGLVDPASRRFVGFLKSTEYRRYNGCFFHEEWYPGQRRPQPDCR
jgi:hypothetical protein